MINRIIFSINVQYTAVFNFLNLDSLSLSVFVSFHYRDLEKNLMLIATHYIEKDHDLRAASRIHKQTESARHRQVKQFALGDLNQTLDCLKK